MNKKLKSLIYLSCFMIAAVVYHFQINEVENEKVILQSEEMAEADIVVEPFSENTTANAVQ